MLVPVPLFIRHAQDTGTDFARYLANSDTGTGYPALYSVSMVSRRHFLKLYELIW
jgi:hypothetical protein